MSGPEPDDVASALLVGGSAGSLDALIRLLASLPGDLPAPVLVVVHIGDRARSQLALVLDRAGSLTARAAQDGERLERGRVYVAPPGRHLLVRPGSLGLSTGPRVNRQRPSIDVMFAGAASWLGSRTVAVVLSGVLDDGAVGAALVARAGGTVFCQSDADFSSMPSAALAAAPGAQAVPAAELGRRCAEALLEHTHLHPPPQETGMARAYEPHTGMAGSSDPAYLDVEETRLTRLSCPDCNGAMAQVDLPRISYFTCHVGHQYSPQSLAAAQAEDAERKLWAAVAALEEQAAVLGYLRQTGQLPADDPVAARYSASVEERSRQLRDQAHSWAASTPLVES